MTELAARVVADARAVGRAVFKFISPNELGLTGSHAYGFLLPIPYWRLFTDMPPTKGQKGKRTVKVTWPDGLVTTSSVTWYGEKTRSEYRLTRFGKGFPFRTAEQVGDLLVLVAESFTEYRAYVLAGDEEIEDVLAELDVNIFGTVGGYEATAAPPSLTLEECLEAQFETFADGLTDFPKTALVAAATQAALDNCEPTLAGESADTRLQRLLAVEYELFRHTERHLTAGLVAGPFDSIEAFLTVAQSITQRRKSRAGHSLEHHTKRLLKEAGLTFETQVKIEGGKKPDVLFPSKKAYLDPAFPPDKLRMLGLKTTCKDRWRQALNEADRIPHKHLLTTQPGMSPTQLAQIKASNLTLVVPKALHKNYKYSKDESAPLMTLEQFIGEMRQLQSAGRQAVSQLGEQVREPCPARSGFQLALPHHQHPPAGSAQLGLLALVVDDVAADLVHPELGTGLGHHEVAAALVLVPEAAVDEDYGATLRQNDIGLAGQVFPVQPEAIAGGVEKLTNQQLRLGILAPDAGHIEGALGGGMDVGHRMLNADGWPKVLLAVS
mgnify:CR=1 FL=1